MAKLTHTLLDAIKQAQSTTVLVEVNWSEIREWGGLPRIFRKKDAWNQVLQLEREGKVRLRQDSWQIFVRAIPQKENRHNPLDWCPNCDCPNCCD